MYSSIAQAGKEESPGWEVTKCFSASRHVNVAIGRSRGGRGLRSSSSVGRRRCDVVLHKRFKLFIQLRSGLGLRPLRSPCAGAASTCLGSDWTDPASSGRESAWVQGDGHKGLLTKGASTWA